MLLYVCTNQLIECTQDVYLFMVILAIKNGVLVGAFQPR